MVGSGGSEFSRYHPNGTQDVALKLSAYTVFSPELELDGRSVRVAMSTRMGERLIIGSDTASQILANSECIRGISEDELSLLQKFGIIVTSNEDELSLVLQENAEARAKELKLFLVIQPTATCQLGCDYCGQLHSKKRLAQPHFTAIEDRLRTHLAAKKWDSLEIGWFGSEPLNAVEEMTSLGGRLQAIAADYDVPFSGLIVTNGVRLTLDAARRLDMLNVQRVEVTLDGGPEYHDARRSTKAGRTTYERIVKNLEAMRAEFGSRFEVVVRCNVDRRNKDGVAPLIEDLRRRGGPDLIDHVYFAPIHNWGNAAESEALSLAEFASLELEWFVRLYQAGWSPRLIPGRVTTPCMVFMEGAELYDAYGNVFNCTEVSYVPAYEIETADQGRMNRYAVGHLSKPTTNRPRPFSNFFELVKNGNVPCAACHLLPACGGKCAKQWEEGTPPCPPEKVNLPQRLALDTLIARSARLALA